MIVMTKNRTNKQPRFKAKKNEIQSYTTTKHANENIAVIENKVRLSQLRLARFA